MAGIVMLEQRTAIEALRAGVPNRAAIRQMGTGQTAIEHEFEQALAAAWPGAASARGGIGLAGGFGTGKSHLIGILAEVARQQDFVVSRVVISKETPLSHAGHVLAAALRDAALPDRPDDPIAACIAILRTRPDALDTLDNEVGSFAPIFSACLFLLRRTSTTPEMMRRIARLWTNGRINIRAFRQALSAGGGARMFTLKSPPATEMTDQLTRFIPRLFRAAGYAGWCILLDEVELIGRYTPLQRALSYAGLATWLGLDPKTRFGGIVVAYAITDDFTTAVINARNDSEKLPARLTLKGQAAAATLAASAIRHIEQTVMRHRLLPPTTADLATCHDKVQELYSSAYDWPAPALPPPERISSRTMRQYIKGWITQWDLLRVDGSTVDVVSGTIASNYDEDAQYETAPASEEEEE